MSKRRLTEEEKQQEEQERYKTSARVTLHTSAIRYAFKKLSEAHLEEYYTWEREYILNPTWEPSMDPKVLKELQDEYLENRNVRI